MRAGGIYFALAFFAFSSLTTTDLLMAERRLVLREVRGAQHARHVRHVQHAQHAQHAAQHWGRALRRHLPALPADGCYRPSSYLLCKAVLDGVLLRVIPVLLYTAPFYPMASPGSSRLLLLLLHSALGRPSGALCCPAVPPPPPASPRLPRSPPPAPQMGLQGGATHVCLFIFTMCTFALAVAALSLAIAVGASTAAHATLLLTFTYLLSLLVGGFLVK